MVVKIKTPRAIVSDIDGTTTSLHYLTETLFPFVQKSIVKFLKERFSNREVLVNTMHLKLHLNAQIQAVLKVLSKQAAKEVAHGEQVPVILNNGEASK